MQLNWTKCQGEVWCPLATVNLAHAHFDGLEGVYIIWHGGKSAAVVRIGQGIIRDRLQAHRTDPEITRYASLGLFVTWAAVPVGQRDGVEAYLSANMKPLVGDRFPNATQIPVNSPWL
jgi:hypothetical protein